MLFYFNDRVNMTEPERELLNEKFKGVHVKLDYITTAVDKTNGRVNAIEAKEIEHNLNCPQRPKIDKMEEELLEYRMLKKYPRFFVVTTVLFGIILILMALSQTGMIG